jgi:GT2 family glycosyltransferase
MNPCSVSVIIPTRDRAPVLEQCLRHVHVQEGGPPETTVVDNSLDQQSVLAVVGRFPSVTYVRADPNVRNPALMRNLGVQASRGDILAFIDDDTLVAPGWLQAVRDAFSDPDVVGATGRVIEFDEPEVSTTEIGRFTSRGQITMNFNNTIDRSVPVEFLYGCNMALRREALVAHRGFDPWLAMAYEDTELNLRLHAARCQLLFWPAMKATHLRWARPDKVMRRAEDFDTASLYRSCRSLAYLCVSQFGLTLDFARVAFVNLPKGALRSFVNQPSASNLLRILSVLAGGSTGYAMAAAQKLGLHRPPALASEEPIAERYNKSCRSW